jgi:hypothetical protein
MVLIRKCQWNWKKITHELQCFIDKTQLIMQHHLYETHEHLSNGRDDLKLSLKTIEKGHEHLVTALEVGHDMISHLLMHMVHGREP